MEEDLRRLYENPREPGGYSSAPQFYRAAKRAGLHVTREVVEKFVSGYKSESLYRRRKRKHVATFAVGLDHKWQLDLGFYPSYRKFAAFLVCVDVLSRKCRLRCIKDKSSGVVAQAFESILEEYGSAPSFVVTDRGTEFLGAPFQQVLARYSIHHYYANPPFKASIRYISLYRIP